MPFGRFTKRDCDKEGTKPPTIDFLGFTMYGQHFAEGNYTVCLKTRKSSLRKSTSNLKEIMKRGMHKPMREQAKRINQSLRGFYQYFGVPFNSRVLRGLYHWVLDAQFNEDDSFIRKNNAAENMAVVRKMALNIIKNYKAQTGKKCSTNGFRRSFGWSEDVMTDILESWINNCS